MIEKKIIPTENLLPHSRSAEIKRERTSKEIAKRVGERVGSRTLLCEAERRIYPIEKGKSMSIPYIRVRCDCGKVDEINWGAFKRHRAMACTDCSARNRPKMVKD